MNEIQVGFTKYSSGEGFGKSIAIGVDGSLVKKAVISMASGKFETVSIPWSEFGAYLSSLTPGEALGFGTCCKRVGIGGSGNSEFLTKGKIVTKNYEVMSKCVDGVSRSRANFKWHESPCKKHNILFIDLDDLADGATIPGSVEKLFGLFPALSLLPGGCWAFASAGSGISSLDEHGNILEELKGLSGLHVYFAVPNSILIDDIANYLTAMGWLSGSNYFKLNQHKFGCSVLERGFIDYSVFQPERLEFSGGTLCGPGLCQDRAVPENFVVEVDAEASSSSTITESFSLSGIFLAEADRLRTEAKEKADLEAKPLRKASMKAVSMTGHGARLGHAAFVGIEEGRLAGLIDITMANGEIVPVWKLIFFPEKYHGRYVLDPLHPEAGDNKATFYWNGRDGQGEGGDRENRFIINSFVHGGTTYRLQTDIDGVREMLKKTDAEEVRARLYAGDGNWLRELACLDNSLELPEILTLLKDRKIMDKAEARTKIGAEMIPDLEVAKVDALAQMNERYAYITVEGKARYVEDTGKELVLRCRNDFLADVENLPKIARWNGATGKVGFVAAGDAWLEWPERRAYPGGLRFEPGINSREFDDPDGLGLVLNRYRGLSFIPSAAGDFKCGRKVCGGRGCFEYFFDEISLVDKTSASDSNSFSADAVADGDLSLQPGICPCKGTWTRWLRTIYDVVCSGDLDHTRWVLDWFCDIIQAPGGHKTPAGMKRSGVSLVVRGGQGTGKDSIVEPIMRILGQYAVTITDIQAISRSFNSFLEDCLLVFGNEAIWGGEKKAGNKLKDIITGNSIQIEHKGINAYSAKNFIRLYAASNSDWVIPAEEDERRYSVFNVGNKYCKNAPWFIEMKSGNLSELLRLILDWKIVSDLNQNLDTDALRDQKELGYSTDSVEAFLEIAIDKMWFWSEDGIGLNVSHEEIEMKYEEKIRRAGQYGDNPEMFKRKLRKWLKDRGASIVAKIKIGNKSTNGFRFPVLEWVVNQSPRLKRAYEENNSEE